MRGSLQNAAKLQARWGGRCRSHWRSPVPTEKQAGAIPTWTWPPGRTKEGAGPGGRLLRGSGRRCVAVGRAEAHRDRPAQVEQAQEAGPSLAARREPGGMERTSEASGALRRTRAAPGPQKHTCRPSPDHQHWRCLRPWTPRFPLRFTLSPLLSGSLLFLNYDC